MNKKLCAVLLGCLLGASIGHVNAAVVLQFGSAEGQTHGRFTTVGGETLELGDLELKNFAMGDPLYKAAVDFSDIGIDPTPTSSFMGFTMFDAWEKSTIGGFSLYANIDADPALEQVLSADVHINYLLVNNASGFLDTLEVDVDIDNFQLVNENLWTVPDLLNDLVAAGMADLALNIVSLGNANLSDAIQNGDMVRDIVVSGTISAVPEPSVVALFVFGIAIFARKKK